MVSPAPEGINTASWELSGRTGGCGGGGEVGGGGLRRGGGGGLSARDTGLGGEGTTCERNERRETGHCPAEDLRICCAKDGLPQLLGSSMARDGRGDEAPREEGAGGVVRMGNPGTGFNRSVRMCQSHTAATVVVCPSSGQTRGHSQILLRTGGRPSPIETARLTLAHTH